MNRQKRLRVFAGSNGSGKSTIIDIVKEHGVDLGVYVNADDIKKEFQKSQSLRFELFGLTIQDEELKDGLKGSSFLNT